MFVLLVSLVSFVCGVVGAVIALALLTTHEPPCYLECAPKDRPSVDTLSPDIPTTSIHDTNKAASAVNSLLQFLFQELKDTGKVRRYFIRKIKVELDELTRRKVISSLIRNIEILDFDMGQSSPEFNTLALRDCKYGGTGLLEDVQLYTHITYKHGFSLSISVETLLEKCAVFTFKLNKFESDGYFVLSREPFTHWYLSFARDPYIEMKVSTHVGARNVPQLANLIAYQLKKAILRKHVWPSYKVRFRPFFNAPPTLDIDDEVLAAPFGRQKASLSCMPFEMVVVDLRRIERLANSFADMLSEPRFKLPQQLVVGAMFSETSVYDETSSRKLFDESYPGVRRIKLPRGLHDCFKLAELTVFRRGFVYVVKTQKAMERLLAVGDVVLQVNEHGVQSIEAFNSIYNDKQTSDNVQALVRRTKAPIPRSSSENGRTAEKKKSSTTDANAPSAADLEEAVRQSLMGIDIWFPPDQLCRMQYSQAKLPAKYVNIAEYVTVRPRGTDAYCNVLLLSLKERHQPTILAFCCFTVEEIIEDCDLTQKRNCQFSRSLFPAAFEAPSTGIGNATAPFGFAHSMAFGHIVIAFRLIESAEAYLSQHNSGKADRNQDNSKQESSACATQDDDVFFVHQLHPFRVESASYCKICNGKIWMKNALRCHLCGVICHQKCASACYVNRCPGFSSCDKPVDVSCRRRSPGSSMLSEDEASEILIFGYREALIMLEDDETLIRQTMQTGHQLSTNSSEPGGKESLMSKVRDLSKTISREFAPYMKGISTSDSADYSSRFIGHAILDNIIAHMRGHARDKLRSLATLYLVHVHAMDELCSETEITESVIEDLVERVCRNEMMGRLSNSISRFESNRSEQGSGGRMRFLHNVGRLVNRGGSYVVSRYRDRVMHKNVQGNIINGSQNNATDKPIPILIADSTEFRRNRSVPQPFEDPGCHSSPDLSSPLRRTASFVSKTNSSID